MVKRVKRGLPPVPTEEEERERLQRLKQEEEETRNELAGMLHQGKSTKMNDKDDEENNESDDGDDDDDDDDENIDTDKSMNDDDGEGEGVEADPSNKPDSCSTSQPPKKKARSKPVPKDYVCFACKNQHLPLHWIYDCPDKVYQPGTNQKKKKLRGMNDPSSRKVFVSGLPFEAKTKEVEAYFEQKCGKVVHCKLILFPDTKRCKGNGFVTFDTDEGATKALALHGETFSMGTTTTTTTQQTTVVNKKELKLGVKRVLNRSQTKK